jgi:hypothetical protein
MSFGTGTGNGAPAILSITSASKSPLLSLLTAEDIQPGSPPSYQVCKTIYTYHPLGAKMAEAPIKLAQSQRREITIPGAPEKELIEAFDKTWKSLAGTGADPIIANAHALKRVYGLSSLMMGIEGQAHDQPIDLTDIHKKQIHFNVYDPLNTSGSLVLNQDPNSPDFLKPNRYIHVAGKPYHTSRGVIMMNGQPIYISFTDSAFGFVGRSVYQPALYPLKTYVLSMLADNAVIEKSALIIAKIKPPGSIIDKAAQFFMGLKREALKGAVTGNVVSIGHEDSVESINLTNLRDAAEFSRNNVLKNIATAADMPASLINQETLAEGFGEGSEDAKHIARFIDGIRIEAQPLYDFIDNIVMHIAWNPDFYKEIQAKYPDYENVPYQTAFMKWKNSFLAVWPNLLQEPDSKKIEVENTALKAAIAAYQVMVQQLDPENRASLAEWFANVINSKPLLFESHLELDPELIKSYTPPATAAYELENPPESGRD